MANSNIITTDQIAFWMNGAGSKRMLSSEEIHSIAKRIQGSPVGSPAKKRAIDKLVSHNLRLVIKYVNMFMRTKSSRNWGDAETMDFLQVGAMGLIRAAEKFDPTMGYTFSTYAMYWIRSYVGRHSIKISSVFYVPESACRDAYSFEKHGFIRQKPYEDSLKLAQMVRAAQSAVSLDAPLESSKGESFVGDYLESHYATEIPACDCFSQETEDLMTEAGLCQDQMKVLRYYFVDGLNARQITELTNFSHNKVCALRKTALKKLRATIATSQAV